MSCDGVDDSGLWGFNEQEDPHYLMFTSTITSSGALRRNIIFNGILKLSYRDLAAGVSRAWGAQRHHHEELPNICIP